MSRRSHARRPTSARRYYTMNPPKKSAGLSDGTKIAIGLGVLALVGGVGYYLYSQSQTQTTAGGAGAGSGTGGTISSGDQPYQLGPVPAAPGLPAAVASAGN